MLNNDTINFAIFRKVVDQLSVEVAYVSRDPRAIVSELKELGAISDEEVQVFSKQLCARMSSFMDYKSASHNVYQVCYNFIFPSGLIC